MPELSDRTKAEIARGCVIAARAQRLRDLMRYVASGKVQIVNTYGDNDVRMSDFIVGGVLVCRGAPSADDYPSETVMATLAMAITATVGMDGLPPVETGWVGREDERDRRRAYHKHVGTNHHG